MGLLCWWGIIKDHVGEEVFEAMQTLFYDDDHGFEVVGNFSNVFENILPKPI